MFKKISEFCTEYILMFMVIIVCLEFVKTIAAYVNGSFNYFHLAYVVLGLVALILSLKKVISAKWLLQMFLVLQIIFIKTLDFEFGFDPALSFPIAFNSSSTENGQLTKLFIFKINLLAIFFLYKLNKFYDKIEQEKAKVSSSE